MFINGTDAVITDITAATATTAAVAARSVSAASSTSADVASFIASAAAKAVMPTAATSADKIAVAFTLLKSAGVDIGLTVTQLATSADRFKYQLKDGIEEGQNITRSIQ